MNPPLFAGIDEMMAEVAREMPSHEPRVHEEIARRVREATAEQLAQELRMPSSSLTLAWKLVEREALARILLNTNLG